VETHGKRTREDQTRVLADILSAIVMHFVRKVDGVSSTNCGRARSSRVPHRGESYVVLLLSMKPSNARSITSRTSGVSAACEYTTSIRCLNRSTHFSTWFFFTFFLSFLRWLFSLHARHDFTSRPVPVRVMKWSVAFNWLHVTHCRLAGCSTSETPLAD
jgi:hypothetical protein